MNRCFVELESAVRGIQNDMGGLVALGVGIGW